MNTNIPIIITNRSHLLDALSLAYKYKHIAIDTEFVWERTYYPLLGIIQIAFSKEECFIIDIQKVKDLSPLGKILEDPSIVKILHDAQQDLMILKNETGSFPISIFDTQLSMGFIGRLSTISLSNCLADILEIYLSKTETRTNWLIRPLTKLQIQYALDDVRYLPEVRKRIISFAKKSNTLAWLDEELLRYNAQKLYVQKDGHERFYRIKGWRKLSKREMTILSELAWWREKEAQRKDKPREHILRDTTLLYLAKEQPIDITKMEISYGLTEKKIVKYGKSICKAVLYAQTMPLIKIIKSKNVKHNDKNSRRVEIALSFIKSSCLQSGIDHAIIGSRAEIASFVKKKSASESVLHNIAKGWRSKFVGDDLAIILFEKKKN